MRGLLAVFVSDAAASATAGVRARSALEPGFTRVAVAPDGARIGGMLWLRKPDASARTGARAGAKSRRRKSTPAAPTLSGTGALAALGAAYEAGGLDALSAQPGAYAAVLWDAKARRLIALRDASGAWPLFVRELSSGGFAVATDPLAFAPLLEARQQLDPAALADFLALGTCWAPASLVAGVRALPPGHASAFIPGLGPQPAQRLAPRPTPNGERRIVDPCDAGGELRRVLTAAVRRTIESAGGSSATPVLWLSAGIDSAALAVCLGELATPATALAVAFDGARGDRLRQSAEVARGAGLPLSFVAFGDAQVRPFVERLLERDDEPIADVGFVPLCVLAAATPARSGITLAGGGGDALFGGSTASHAERRLRRLGPLEPLIAGLGGQFGRALDGPGLLWSVLRRFGTGLRLRNPWRQVVWRGAVPPASVRALLAPALRARLDSLPGGVPALAEVAAHWARTRGRSARVRVRLLEREGFDAPRALVAASAPAFGGPPIALPFADPEVAAFAAALPESLVFHRDAGRVLRVAFAHRLPECVRNRRRRPERVPLSRWLAGPLLPLLEDRLAPARVRAAGLFDPRVVSRLMREHAEGRRNRTRQLWALLLAQAYADRLAAGH